MRRTLFDWRIDGIRAAFLFPRPRDAGWVLPAFYDVIAPSMVRDALALGGKDVSDDAKAWSKFNREVAEFDAIIA